MNHFIEVCDVEKYYGKGSNVTKAVDRVSFCVDQGEFLGIMGVSGSGKTTLLNILSTIDSVTSGHVFYGPDDITVMNEDQLSDFRRDNLGFVFQDFNLLDTLTVRENIVLALSLQGKHGKEAEERPGRLWIFWTFPPFRINFLTRYPADRSSAAPARGRWSPAPG